MDADDQLVGHIISRREAVRILGLAGAAALTPWSTSRAQVASGVAVCAVKPELTEGPYFADDQLTRVDIRTDPGTTVASNGVPLALSFVVSQIAAGRCTPVPQALVDVWQCDAEGRYSGVNDPSFGASAIGQRFLRGNQRTDSSGAARFLTIFPGWYRGRAVHVHFKIRTAASSGVAYEFTSQLFFDEALTDVIHATEPYARKGRRDTPNDRDGIYRNGGVDLLLNPRRQPDGSYQARVELALDLSDANVGRSDSEGNRGRPGGPRGRGRGASLGVLGF